MGFSQAADLFRARMRTLMMMGRSIRHYMPVLRWNQRDGQWRSGQA